MTFTQPKKTHLEDAQNGHGPRVRWAEDLAASHGLDHLGHKRDNVDEALSAVPVQDQLLHHQIPVQDGRILGGVWSVNWRAG